VSMSTTGAQALSKSITASSLAGWRNLETGMISTLVGRRWHGLDVDQLLENLINAGGSKVRLAIITGQLQSIKNGRSSSILPERATRIRGTSGSRLRNRRQCK
jgi:hypothetical protein